MTKACQFCGKDPKKSALPLARKCPRRRPYLGLYTVCRAGADPKDTVQVCRPCFEVFKSAHQVYSAQSPRF